MGIKQLKTLSYAILALALILTGALHLGTLVVAALFSYFALQKMQRGQRKWVPIALFLILVVLVLDGFGYFVGQAFHALPMILNKSIPAMVQYAQVHNIDLPFTDVKELKTTLMDIAKDELHFVGNFARLTSRVLVFLLLGFVIAVSVFLNSRMDLAAETHAIRNNSYSALCEEIAARFRSFYRSFDLVMGAQLIISLINTTLTSIFVIVVAMPYAWMIVVVTFLCGLMPIVGNLISNAIIVGVAFTKSPQMALISLVFLVAVHKLEYFLNSKIIGTRIKNPVWLTLIGIILGERLMGIAGMILAPVLLHFIKQEMSRVAVASEPSGPTV